VDRELEIRIGIRIDAALDRVRSKVYLMGMAGKWHIGKASGLLQNPDLIERYVEQLGEHEEAKYLDQLPLLVAEAEKQDRRCAECWDTGIWLEQESHYRAEREKLIRLFKRFHFRPKLYEKLVRQPDKPLLREAIGFLNAGREITPEAIALERIVRLHLRDFVRIEEGLVDDFCDLDEAWDTLSAAHKELALKMAMAQPGSDESTVSSALVGLRRAAAWYDYKRGYSFEEYAQDWVQEAIVKRR